MYIVYIKYDTNMEILRKKKKKIIKISIYEYKYMKY